MGEHLWWFADGEPSDPGPTAAGAEPPGHLRAAPPSRVAAQESAPAAPSRGNIFLRVAEAITDDVERGVARLDPQAFEALGSAPGDVITISGRRATLARSALDASGDGQGRIRLDGQLRDNARTSLDARVAVGRVDVPPARQVQLTPTRADEAGEIDLARVREALLDRPLREDDDLRIHGLVGGARHLRVQRVDPGGQGVVTATTHISVGFAPSVTDEADRQRVRYEDLGGLHDELRRVRELVEFPIKYPALFARLGVKPPRGVLLHGPPGTGKTLIARTVASEVNAHFVLVNGPEIIDKWYGQSEARLREIFDDAERNAPSIIFIDELDALAPRRADVSGEMEKRVVAQLLTLMDGLVDRGQVVVIGATNMPDHVEPALRRPGRFDREVTVPVPNRDSRAEILRIHSRPMPLAADVDLLRLADVTQGFVGADIEVLCKEAGMLALHEVLERAGFEVADANDLAAKADVHLRHFLAALRTIEPTAIREIFVEKPDVTWAAVGGLSRVRDFLDMAVIVPRRAPELFRQAGMRPPKGIVLHGPSGTGKSLVARALAHESGLSFLSVDPAMLFSKWLGESEKILHQVFVKARQAAPCLLLFDQLDALAPARGNAQSGASPDRLLGQLLSEFDNLDELSEVVVLATTNRLDLVDPSLLSSGRLDSLVEITLPDRDDRRAILAIHAARLPRADDVDLDALAEASEGLSGAQLALICHQAGLAALRAQIGSADPRGLRIPHARFAAALAEMQAPRRQPGR